MRLFHWLAAVALMAPTPGPESIEEAWKDTLWCTFDEANTIAALAGDERITDWKLQMGLLVRHQITQDALVRLGHALKRAGLAGADPFGIAGRSCPVPEHLEHSSHFLESLNDSSSGDDTLGYSGM